MTPEEINRAIAEHCGWEPRQVWGRCDHDDCQEEGHWEDVPLPDYYNDLNAMHSAEKIFDTEGAEAYEDKLADVCCVDKEQNCKTTSFLFHATAAQRAEAFLRTIGKWRDTTKEEVA